MALLSPSSAAPTSAPADERSGPTGARLHPPPPVPQHSLPRSVLLHLLPGAAMAGSLLVSVPVLRSWGVDPLFALLLAIPLVLAPIELGYLSVTAKRTTGSWSPLRAVAYRDRPPLGRLVLVASGLAAWMLVLVGVSMVLLDEWIAERVLGWLPESILSFADLGDGGAVSGTTLAVLLVTFFICNGLVGPVTEELYFRGHLLPRLERLGRGAPVLHTVLFALYHLHTPWRLPAIVLGYLPAVWLTWRRRSLWYSLVTHLVVNNLFVLMMLAAYLERR
jgi:uncharacterized protein